MLHQQILELDFFLQLDQSHKFSDISDKLLEKQFSIKDVGVTHRWITHWDEIGLLTGATEKGKWRKFNFIEYTWLKIILESRKYNIPLKTMHWLKDILIGQFDIEHALDNPEVMNIILSRAPKGKRDEVEAFIKDKKLMKQVAQENPIEVWLLHLIVLDIIVLKSHYAILINTDGDIIPLKESFLDKYYDIAGFNEFMHGSYLSISVTEIIKDFIADNDLELVETRLALITNQEAEVIRTIREKDLISLKIRFDKNNQMDLMEITKEQKLKRESRFLDAILSKGYQEIIIKTEEGNIVRCTNTLKKKLQK